MPEIQKVSIALTGEQVTTLKAAVESGEYATTSEVVREALRDWQKKRDLHGEDVQRLRQMWVEGKRSGAAIAPDLSEVRQKARKRLKEAASRQLAHAS